MARAWVLATARPGDPELDVRIADTGASGRPAGRRSRSSKDLAGAVAATEPTEPVLVEALTSGSACSAATRRRGRIRSSRPARRCPCRDRGAARAGVVVSDEIGVGLVPIHGGARSFRDLGGLAHQRIAAQADVVDLSWPASRCG